MGKYYQISSYLSYLKRSVNRHAIHSPFAFDLIETVLKSHDTDSQDTFRKIELARKALLRNDKRLEYLDIGANQGPKSIKVCQLARRSLSTPAQCRVLSALVKRYDHQNVFEIGTSLGVSAAYMAKSTSGKVTTLEGIPEIQEEARRLWANLGIENVEAVLGDFSQSLAQSVQTTERIDLAFIDGNHKKEPTINYYEIIRSKCHEASVVVLDDIHWSKEMDEAWSELSRREEVTMSIDLYWAGLLFFKPGLSKSHFTIRY